ncbi:beta-glucoside-specific PTS transporter subunit IIABC [Cellulomonas sp. NPDC089187]|uniref:beta-glucoside-specific PTS transporter subunit IIABC n=1 Tax=Cellulomonas sp. NPDC089187 TaxID=3154970 RepID=UPI00342C2D50
MASASKYQTIAEDVLRGVGGKENVASVVHCATRLRFRLKDRALADKDAVESTSGVITVMESGGQFQVVIGNTVPRVHEALGAMGVNTGDGSADEAEVGEKGNLMARIIDMITSIFTPFLWVLAATGLIKALLALVAKISPDFAGTTTYAFWYAAGDAAFQLLPIFLAITAARKFKANVYTAVAIAAGLLYGDLFTQLASPDGALNPDGSPVLVGLTAFSAGGGDVNFLGIPLLFGIPQAFDWSVALPSSLSALIPILVAVWVQSKFEPLVSKILPDFLRNFVTPVIVLAVLVPFTYILIGPLANLVSSGISAGIEAVWDTVPWLGGALIAGFWQVFVIFGVHWGFVPIMQSELQDPGFSYLTAALFPAVLAQAGAVVAVLIRTKNKDLRAVAGPAAVSGFLAGITEPAIYGVTLRLKKPFIYAAISGAIGGAIVALGKGATDVFALPGLITITAALNHGFASVVIGTSVAVVLAFLLTLILGFKDIPNKEDAAAAAATGTAPTASGSGTTTATLTDTKVVEVSAPVNGTVIPLSEVADKVFASGALGKGVGVVPADGQIVSPVSGTVVSVLPHAYGLVSDDGVEVLVHVGINTVELEGKGFTPAVQQGAQVLPGTPLVSVDLAAIRAAGLDTTTIVLVTNTDSYADVVAAPAGDTTSGTPLLTVVG